MYILNLKLFSKIPKNAPSILNSPPYLLPTLNLRSNPCFSKCFTQGVFISPIFDTDYITTTGAEETARERTEWDTG